MKRGVLLLCFIAATLLGPLVNCRCAAAALGVCSTQGCGVRAASSTPDGPVKSCCGAPARETSGCCDSASDATEGQLGGCGCCGNSSSDENAPSRPCHCEQISHTDGLPASEQNLVLELSLLMLPAASMEPSSPVCLPAVVRIDPLDAAPPLDVLTLCHRLRC